MFALSTKPPLRTHGTRGFTILELVVVIALLTTLGGMFALNTSTARDQARLDAATRELQSLLREAQTLGRTGRMVSNTNCTALYDCGYGVYVLNNGSGTLTVRFYEGRGAGDSSTQADNQFDSDVNTPIVRSLDVSRFNGSISIQDAGGSVAPSDNVHVHFRRGLLGAVISTVDGTMNHASTSISLATDSGFSNTVVVNSAGLIYVE